MCGTKFFGSGSVPVPVTTFSMVSVIFSVPVLVEKELFRNLFAFLKRIATFASKSRFNSSSDHGVRLLSVLDPSLIFTWSPPNRNDDAHIITNVKPFKWRWYYFLFFQTPTNQATPQPVLLLCRKTQVRHRNPNLRQIQVCCSYYSSILSWKKTILIFLLLKHY